MWRVLATGSVLAVLLLACGCMTKPLADNPLFFRPDPTVTVENPVFVPLGPPAYGQVFENILDITDDYFEISYTNRYDGRILTFPRISPGIGQPWKPGTVGAYQRLQATCQSMRRRAEIQIQPADDGGFFIQVIVYKELEDVPKPTLASVGAATFRAEPSVERQFEVIDPGVLDTKWIPQGRDTCLEQEILQRIKRCM